MGTLILPNSGLVYLDASPIIYTVEKHPVYGPLLAALWMAAKAGTFEVISSELSALECFVGPMKKKDAALLKNYESALYGTEMRVLPITQSVLRDGAELRAAVGLKTPDAIHGATAKQAGCDLFVTNDPAFRRIPGLTVVVLDDLRTP